MFFSDCTLAFALVSVILSSVHENARENKEAMDLDIDREIQ